MSLSEVLAKLQVLEKAATPGPWKQDDHSAVLAPGGDEFPYGSKLVAETPNYLGNAAFIAAIRNATPALLRIARSATRQFTCSGSTMLEVISDTEERKHELKMALKELETVDLPTEAGA